MKPSPNVIYNRGAFVLVVILLILLTVTTHYRNTVWHTKLSLWSDAARKSPMKSRTHNNVGNCFMLVGWNFKAIEEYKTAVALDPGNIEAYYNLGINLEHVGILSQAVYYYNIFCKSAPARYRQEQQSSCERVLALSGSLKNAR